MLMTMSRSALWCASQCKTFEAEDQICISYQIQLPSSICRVISIAHTSAAHLADELSTHLHVKRRVYVSKFLGDVHAELLFIFLFAMYKTILRLASM